MKWVLSGLNLKCRGAMVNRYVDLLTDDQVLALKQAIHHYPKNWKQEIHNAWINGNYPIGIQVAPLQRLRNSASFPYLPSEILLKVTAKDILEKAQNLSQVSASN